MSTIVEFKKREERRKRRERRQRSRVANRLAGKLQALVLTNPIAALEVEKLVDRLLRMA